MRKVLIIGGLLISFLTQAQLGERFRPGYIIDRSGEKYEGLLRLEPGTEKNPGAVTFKEDKKGKKEVYGPSYVRAFRIESDSFTVLKKIPMPRRKVREADFARVVLAGAGGVVYQLEYEIEKTSGHAATEYRTTEETSKYYLQINGKIAMLTASNFKDVAVVVSDCADLKTKIAAKKLKFADLEKVVDEYNLCRPKQTASK